MRSSDWQPMETAPLNPYGKAFGPTVLIWCTATGTPLPAYYSPMHGWEYRSTGPAWIVDDGRGDAPIAPEDAWAWAWITLPKGQKGSAGVKQSLTAAEPDPETVVRIQSAPDPWGYSRTAADDDTPVEFLDWFRKNYPGPDTIIFKPDWHAPRIWRAMLRCLERKEPPNENP